MPMRNGFTLSELLIALAILGVIAAFTIPKVLSSQQDERKRSTFRETVTALNEILYQGALTGTITKQADFSQAVNAKLNVVRFCPTDASPGCWDSAVQGTGPWAPQVDEPGMVLHNGVTIAGIGNGPSEADTFIVDWNGTAPPNSYGNDQLTMVLCFKMNANCTAWTDATYTGRITTGTISPGGDAGDLALWNWIFQKS